MACLRQVVSEIQALVHSQNSSIRFFARGTVKARQTSNTEERQQGSHQGRNEGGRASHSCLCDHHCTIYGTPDKTNGRRPSDIGERRFRKDWLDLLSTLWDLCCPNIDRRVGMSVFRYRLDSKTIAGSIMSPSQDPIDLETDLQRLGTRERVATWQVRPMSKADHERGAVDARSRNVGGNGHTKNTTNQYN